MKSLGFSKKVSLQGYLFKINSAAFNEKLLS